VAENDSGVSTVRERVELRHFTRDDSEVVFAGVGENVVFVEKQTLQRIEVDGFLSRTVSRIETGASGSTAESLQMGSQFGSETAIERLAATRSGATRFRRRTRALLDDLGEGDVLAGARDPDGRTVTHRGPGDGRAECPPTRESGDRCTRSKEHERVRRVWTRGASVALDRPLARGHSAASYELAQTPSSVCRWVPRVVPRTASVPHVS
jgi:hypothetical protein